MGVPWLYKMNVEQQGCSQNTQDLEPMDRMLRNFYSTLQVLAILICRFRCWCKFKSLSNVSSGSANSLHWIVWSSIPHTIQSRSISFNEVSKLKCSDRWQSSATYVEIDSPPWQFLVLKQYLWTITDGLGSWCFVTRSTMSLNFSSVGFLGDAKLWISL